MEMRVLQRFPCAPRRYWDATRGEAFEARIRDAAEVDVEPIAREIRGEGRVWERYRVVHRQPMTLVAQKAFGASHLAYEQEVESDDDAMTTQWKVSPAFLADRVRCSGTSEVRSHPGGCERLILGDVRVDLPFVGSVIERQIVDQMTRSYAKAEPVIRRFLEEA
jgi:hypothetical protein